MHFAMQHTWPTVHKLLKFWQVGLNTFVVVTPWWWHLGAEKCRSLCMSCVSYHEVYLLANISIVVIEMLYNHNGQVKSHHVGWELLNFGKYHSGSNAQSYIISSCIWGESNMRVTVWLFSSMASLNYSIFYFGQIVMSAWRSYPSIFYVWYKVLFL